MLKKLVNYVAKPFLKTEVRNDGFANRYTGLGARNSRTETSGFIRDKFLDVSELTNIYTGNGVGKRIVSIIVEDATREFINCSDDSLAKELERLKFKQHVLDAAIFGRLYGACLLVAFVDDGRELHQPLNHSSVKQLVSFRCYDRYQISWTPQDLDVDVYSENYGKPDIFTIYPQGMTSQSSFRVHKSRCHLFAGDRLPNKERVVNLGWDMSVLQSVYAALRDYSISMTALAEVLQDHTLSVMKVNGLTQMLAQPDGEMMVMGRISRNDLLRSVSKTVLIDAEFEDFIKLQSSVAGFPEAIDRLQQNLSAVCGIPITKLFGESSAGLNSTNKGDADNWHNVVNSYRTDEIQPAICWVVEMLENQKLWMGDKPKSFDWSFPSLKQIDDAETAKINLTTAQIDQIYIDRGAFDAMEIAKLRYADGQFQQNISIEGVETEAKPEDYEVDIEEADEDVGKEADKKEGGNKVNTDSDSLKDSLRKVKLENLLKRVKNEF